MGLISAILLAPIAPVRGVVALAGVIQRQVDQEMSDPANTRRELEEVQKRRDRGEINPEQEETAQAEILKSRISPQRPGSPIEEG